MKFIFRFYKSVIGINLMNNSIDFDKNVVNLFSFFYTFI